MRPVKITVASIICALILISAGCDSQVRDLKLQNDTQRKHIADLESQLQAQNLQLEQMKRQLEAMSGKGNIEMSAMQQKIAGRRISQEKSPD